MGKAQSLIVQFILFFLIGFSIFLAVGNLFKTRSDIVRSDITDTFRKLTNSYISSITVSSFDSCKQCDIVSSTLVIEKRVTDNFLEILLDSSGMTISTQPEGKSIKSSIHNLKDSLQLSGRASSANPITLTLYKTQNKLEVK